MSIDKEELGQAISDAMMSSLIRFTAIVFIAFVCIWAFAPFLPIMLWALVLAIALYPVHVYLHQRLGGSGGRSATLLVIAGLVLIGLPAIMMGSAFATQLLELAGRISQGQSVIPAPPEGLEELPLVGADLNQAWQSAHSDISYLERYETQIIALGKWISGIAAGTAGSIFKLLGALIISGIMLAWTNQASQSTGRIFARFVGEEKGLLLQDLTTKTIRSVAIGIIGIAFVTALVMGAVLTLAGIPGAGILAVVALILGIMQIPVTLVALVGVALLWAGDNSAVYNIVFTVVMLAASLIDNILKPMVLGRGLDVPMPVVLIGALGGMMSGGILGMFIGAAFLSAGYQIFMGWVEAGSREESDRSGSESVAD